MNSLSISFVNRALRYLVQGFEDFLLVRQCCQIFRILDFLPAYRKEQDEFVFSRLEQAEGAILGTVNDLDIFHFQALRLGVFAVQNSKKL